MDDLMRDQYHDYLKEHIGNVALGFDWVLINLPELLEAYDADYIGEIISKHDASKYDAEEFVAYAEYFYGKDKSDEVQEEFDKAWLHHQHHNPHHWQHWLLREDNGNTVALEMPYEYILEMVMDHWAFSWKANNLYEIFKWYEDNKEKMLLHPDTQKTYESILEKLKNRLDEVHSNGDKE